MIKVRETLRDDIWRRGYLSYGMAKAAATIWRNQPIPFPIINLARALTPNRNPLWPRGGVVIMDPARIEDPVLRALLTGRKFGVWGVNHDVVSHLDRLCTRLNPRAVLEFGSGTSTLVFARHFARRGITGRAVFSIDQDERYAADTRRDLAALGLGGIAEVTVAAMGPASFDGRPVQAFQLSADLLDRVDWPAVDLVFIDGPFGDGPVRGPILPAILRRLRRGARVILDDALRDNELRILALWDRLSDVRVAGIRHLRAGMAEIEIG